MGQRHLEAEVEHGTSIHIARSKMYHLGIRMCYTNTASLFRRKKKKDPAAWVLSLSC
jgi:hypothetical protein